MSKAIKAAAKVFVVTFLVVTGAAFLLGTVGMTGAFFFGVSTTTIAALSAVSTLISGLMSKGISSTAADNFGTKVSTRSAVAPRQIIYGRCRVGGTITHIETRGTDNFKLQMVVVLAGHEIDALEDVLVNDEVLTTTTASGFQVVTNSKFTNTDNENNFGSGRLMRFVFVDGSQTAANSTVTSACSLNSNDKFIGCAYLYIEMVFDSEAFGGGIPPLAFVVRGKKVFDPRNNATVWSENPALCVRDYISDTSYGLKATSTEINDTTALGGFKSAANTCDSSSTVATATTNGTSSSSTDVNLNAQPTNTLIDVGHIVTGTGISGTVTVIRRRLNKVTLSSAQSITNGVTLTFTEGAFTANGISNMSASGSSVIEGLLSSCAGKLSYIDGKFVMFAGAGVTPDMTITDDNLLAPVTITTKQASGETYNTVKAVYVDANTNYVATDSPVFTSSTFLSADTPTGESSANYRKTLEIQLPFTDTSSMAQRLQKTALLHHRKEVTLSVLCNIGYMQLQPFDWVYVTNARLGYTNKTFEVLSTNLEVTGDTDAPVLATALALKEIDASVYNFAQSEYTNPIDEGTTLSTGSFAVTAPTNFAVANPVVVVEQATTNISINTTWTNNPSDDVQGTEIKYGTSSGTYTESQIVGKGVTSLNITNLLQNQTYYFVARHFSGNNVFSGLTSQVSKATGASTTAPSVPTNLDASDGSPLAVKVSWTNPNNSDLSSVKIYATTSNSAPTNETTLKATVAGEPNAISTISFGEQDGLTAGTTFYFWAKAVNKTGLTSAFTSSNSGNFTKVEAPDINLPDFSGYFHKEGNTTTALTSSQFNTEYGRTPLNDDILIMVNTSASPKVSKAYKWNGSAFVEISNFTTGDLIVDGTIAGAKVIARTIEAGNIATGTLTANEIAAGTITATQIAADAITAVKIDVNNLQAISSDLGSISGGSLNIGSGTFVVASNGALTATSATITGAVTATSGSFTGSLTSTSGTIGGFTLGSTSLIGGSGSTRVSLSTADGIHLGNNTFGSAPFRVTPAGALTSTNATITGAVTATSGSFTGSLTSTSGTIGGFTLGSTSLVAGSGTSRVSLSTADGIHLGNNTFGSAPFRVTRAGALTATNATITGEVNATSGTFNGSIAIGSGNSIFKADSNGIYLGNATFGSAPFRVTPAGALTATNATITGAITATSGSFAGSLSSASGTFTGALSGGTISIGSSNNIFKADSNGIYLGNASFGSAPFKVTPAGALTATGVTINGDLTLTNIDGTTVTYNGGNLVVGTIGSANLADTAIFPATLRFERSNATTAPSDSEFNTAFGRNPKANDIVVVARTDTNAQVAYKHDGSSFSAISNYIDGDLIVDGTVTASQIAANTITATQIAASTITGTQINVDTLNVKHFADVSADIFSQTGSAVPLEVFGSVFERASNNFTTQTQSTGTYLPLTIANVRNGAKYRAILSGVYGDCTNGFLEYSINGSSYVQATGIQSITMAAGTFRSYVLVYSGTISGMSSSQSTVYWRLRWVTKLRSTYQSLYVFIDNTQ